MQGFQNLKSEAYLIYDATTKVKCNSLLRAGQMNSLQSHRAGDFLRNPQYFLLINFPHPNMVNWAVFQILSFPFVVTSKFRGFANASVAWMFLAVSLLLMPRYSTRFILFGRLILPFKEGVLHGVPDKIIKPRRADDFQRFHISYVFQSMHGF